jgi:hypothetical protein
MTVVNEILNSHSPTPTKPEFQFDFTLKAAQHNASVLEKYDFDFVQATEAQGPHSTISMGSELRPTEQLDKLLSHHPNYPLLCWNTVNGIDYPLQHLTEEQRVLDLNNQLEKGNHKSALHKDATIHVNKAMHSDIDLGYSIPITTECI